MTIRQRAPGRGSTSQTGFVNPCGPHHCPRCFGSVQALKTSSRGASISRLMTKSASSFLAAMLLVLALEFFEVLVEAVEAFFPEPAIVFHPVGDVLERLGPQTAWPPLCVPAPGDQAGPLQ